MVVPYETVLQCSRQCSVCYTSVPCIAGTGSDWSTEELDFETGGDAGSRIDWNEDVERELALQVTICLH